MIASILVHAALGPTNITRKVPAQAEELAVIAEEAGLVYRGGTLATFGDALRIACVNRTTLSPEGQRIIMERQRHQCALCDNADGPLEFDHITPVSIGGSDDLDNMQALCIADHRLKSDQE